MKVFEGIIEFEFSGEGIGSGVIPLSIIDDRDKADADTSIAALR